MKFRRVEATSHRQQVQVAKIHIRSRLEKMIRIVKIMSQVKMTILIQVSGHTCSKIEFDIYKLCKCSTDTNRNYHSVQIGTATRKPNSNLYPSIRGGNNGISNDDLDNNLISSSASQHHNHRAIALATSLHLLLIMAFFWPRLIT